jgi:YD repeat-containing protein
MNKKYIKYIDYIVNDIELPYIKSLEPYGLKQDEMDLVLSKVFNQTVIFIVNRVFDIDNNEIYYERSSGYWVKYDYDNDGNQIYREDVDGNCAKYEYDEYSNKVYLEDSRGFWWKKEYDNQGNKIYYEDSNGYIEDNR